MKKMVAGMVVALLLATPAFAEYGKTKMQDRAPVAKFLAIAAMVAIGGAIAATGAVPVGISIAALGPAVGFVAEMVFTGGKDGGPYTR